MVSRMNKPVHYDIQDGKFFTVWFSGWTSLYSMVSRMDKPAKYGLLQG